MVMEIKFFIFLSPENGRENRVFFIFSPQKAAVKISFFSLPKNGRENKTFYFISPKTVVKIKMFYFLFLIWSIAFTRGQL